MGPRGPIISEVVVVLCPQVYSQVEIINPRGEPGQVVSPCASLEEMMEWNTEDRPGAAILLHCFAHPLPEPYIMGLEPVDPCPL